MEFLEALSETIAAIQDVVRKLSWPIEQINSFIGQEFHGRRRAQLSDEELVQLLYRLRVQCLEKVQVNPSKAQDLQALITYTYWLVSGNRSCYFFDIL